MERELGNTREAENVEARVRKASRSLMISAARAETTADLGNGIQIARLEVGIDPDTIDRSSGDYRIGAAEALSAAHNAAAEMLIDPGVASRLLGSSTFSRPFAGLFANNLSLSGIMSELEMKEHEVYMAMDFLNRTGLVEPAVSPTSGVKHWRASAFGEHTFMKLLPELAKSVPTKELLSGVERWLEHKK